MSQFEEDGLSLWFEQAAEAISETNRKAEQHRKREAQRIHNHWRNKLSRLLHRLANQVAIS